MQNEILIIEDDENISENIAEILELEQFKVTRINNGNDGIKIAKRRIPSLILCDITMRNINGYEVLQALKKDYATALIPFVFLTAKADIKALRKGMDMGADDYLIKPFSKDELLTVINVRLEKSRLNQKRISELQKSIRNSLPHEMRTPLTSIMGFSEVIKNSFDDLKREEIIGFAGYIYDASERLNYLIDNFLLASELDLAVNNMPELNNIRRSVFSKPSVTAHKIAEEKAAEAGRINDISIFAFDEVNIIAGEYYFVKAVSEVVSNALKFSEPGSKVVLQTHAADDFFSVVVTNESKLTSEQVNNVTDFMQFSRDKEEKPGVGLGLSITKKIMQIFSGYLNIRTDGNLLNVELKFRIIYDNKSTFS